MGKVSIDQALEHARRLVERGDHARARKVYGKILRTAPRNAEAKAGLATLISTANQAKPAVPSENTSLSTLSELLEKNLFEAAKKRAEKLVESHSSSAEFWNLYGIALREIKDLDAALSAARKAKDLSPNTKELTYNLALIHYRMGNLNEARGLFYSLTETNPDWAKPHFRLGDTLKSDDRIQDALPHYKRAAELAPENPRIQNGYGVILNLTDQPEDAIIYFQKAIDLYPDYPQAHFNLANALKKTDRILEAIEEYEKTVAIDPNLKEAWLNLGNTLAVEKRYDECIECYDRVIALDPNDTKVMRAKGQTLIAQGNVDEAQTYLTGLLPAFPDFPKFHFYIGRTYKAQGEIQKSISSVSEAYRLDPEDIAAFSELASYPRGTLPEDIIEILERNYLAMSSKLPVGSSDFIKAHVLRHLGDYESSWHHYVQANEIIFARDRKSVRDTVVDQNQTLARLLKKPAPKPIYNDEDPISLFINAPSRSGKTRLENLLASSPLVKRGYENPSFSMMAKKLSYSIGLGPINRLTKLHGEAKREFLKRYKARLHAVCGQKRIFTDTSPHRISNAWDIADLIPNSYFIFLDRSPVDVAVGIFQRHYRTGGNFYAYHPDTIRDHLVWYRNMRKTLSELLGNRAITISYSDLVADPGGQLQRIEDLLGLRLNCVVPAQPLLNTSSPSDPFRKLMMSMPKETSPDFLLTDDEDDSSEGSDNGTSAGSI
jgi:tetratricopeptide (TPR) repeat protein